MKATSNNGGYGNGYGNGYGKGYGPHRGHGSGGHGGPLVKIIKVRAFCMIV